MPIEINRAGLSANPDVQEAVQDQHLRLPGDHAGPIGWICPSCHTQNTSRPGIDPCSACGAGADAKLAPPSQRSRPYDQPMQLASEAAPAVGLAAKLAERMRPASNNESLRLIIREELQAVLGGPKFSEKEKTAILTGLGALVMQPDLLDDSLPSSDELQQLMERIQGS